MVLGCVAAGFWEGSAVKAYAVLGIGPELTSWRLWKLCTFGCRCGSYVEVCGGRLALVGGEEEW